MVKVGLIQMSCVDENRPEPNLEKAFRMIDEAAGKGANIVALQELFNTPYFPNRPRDSRKYFEMAETIPGPTIERVADKAREHKMVIMAPIYEREMAGVYYNSAAVIGPDGELIGVYRKMHIPHSEDFIEKYYFKPGNLGFPVFDTPFGKIGILICYDRHFPEGARALGLAGAEILLIPVASPRPTASEVFVKELMGMAIANQYFVAAVNRVGVELKEEFYGTSLVCDPRGNIIAQAGSQEDEVLVTEIDLAQVETTRNNWLFYRDRRPDAYDALLY
jgi:N-carbamoylputrescine amidase